MNSYDLCVIGAGPAGMAAASCAAEAGAAVLLLDEQSSPGGQIYRAIASGGQSRAAVLGPDYLAGRALADKLSQSVLTYRSGATVWRVDPDGTVAFSVDGEAEVVQAKRLIIATGATERPYAFPGWTLPGVMMAGAGQILLKANGLALKDAVIAGSGPLLYLIAQQLVAAGAPPKAVVELTDHSNRLAALRHLPGALRGWRYLAKGWSMLAALRRAGVPRYKGASKLRALGEGAVEGIAFTVKGREQQLDCTTLLIHQGVVPNVQITRSLGLPHDWDAAQRCWRPRSDDWGTTALENIAVAGDGGGIGGARAAEHAGRLAALEALRALGLLNERERDLKAAPQRAALARETAVRPFLDALYAPPSEALRPSDETIVCRCEEVTAGEIRRLANLDCQGPNQMKAFSRCGMGPCQGRYCGLTVSEIIAEEKAISPEEVGYYRIRPPLKPITLGELAQAGEAILGEDDAQQTDRHSQKESQTA